MPAGAARIPPRKDPAGPGVASKRAHPYEFVVAARPEKEQADSPRARRGSATAAIGANRLTIRSCRLVPKPHSRCWAGIKQRAQGTGDRRADGHWASIPGQNWNSPGPSPGLLQSLAFPHQYFAKTGPPPPPNRTFRPTLNTLLVSLTSKPTLLGRPSATRCC